MRTLPSKALLLAALLPLSGCLKLEEPQARAPSIEFQGRPVGDIVDATHGKETWFAVGALGGVAPHKGNGVATAHYLADGTFILGLRLNRVPAPEGSILEAWLERENGTEALRLGTMTSMLGDAKHELRFETAKDLRETHPKIVVRMRKTSDPTTPGEVVAEGVLKPQSR